MFQQILDLLTRIDAALTVIATGSGGLTATQTQAVVTSLTALAKKAESLGGPAPVPTVTITGIAPNPAAIGAQVTIAGSGFGTTQGSGTLDFNGVTGSATMWTDGSIVAVVPAGASTGPLTVTSNAGGKASAAFAIQ